VTTLSSLWANLPGNLAGIGLELPTIDAVTAGQLTSVVASSSVKIVSGTEGADTLTGTDGRDLIFGLGGDDTLNGGNGNDFLFGGEGGDTLNGDAGADWLFGGSGNDLLNGGVGDDRLYGEAGNDTIDGGDGNDTIDSGAGDDIVRGGGGKDRIFGRPGNDDLRGGEGRDSVEYSTWGQAVTLAFVPGVVERPPTFPPPPGTPERFLTVPTGTATLKVFKGTGESDAISDTSILSQFGSLNTRRTTDFEEIRGAVGQANSIDFSRITVYDARDRFAPRPITAVVYSDGIAANLAESSLTYAGQTLVVRNFVNAFGTPVADTLIGNDQNNVLVAGDSYGAAIDTLVGNGGNDRLVANLTGRTVMTGGSGADDFVVTQFETIFPGQVRPGVRPDSNTITDFTPGRDRILLSRQTTNLQPIAADKFSLGTANEFGKIVYDPATGKLFTGGYPWAAVVLQGAPTLTASDIFTVAV
jgi:Ca2+-binding RTX toxin-like protein